MEKSANKLAPYRFAATRPGLDPAIIARPNQAKSDAAAVISWVTPRSSGLPAE